MLGGLTKQKEPSQFQVDTNVNFGSRQANTPHKRCMVYGMWYMELSMWYKYKVSTMYGSYKPLFLESHWSWALKPQNVGSFWLCGLLGPFSNRIAYVDIYIYVNVHLKIICCYLIIYIYTYTYTFTWSAGPL